MDAALNATTAGRVDSTLHVVPATPLRCVSTGVVTYSCCLSTETMSPPDTEVPYGTLDLMVLTTLSAMGPLHGYGIARRIEQVAEGRAGA